MKVLVVVKIAVVLILALLIAVKVNAETQYILVSDNVIKVEVTRAYLRPKDGELRAIDATSKNGVVQFRIDACGTLISLVTIKEAMRMEQFSEIIQKEIRKACL